MVRPARSSRARSARQLAVLRSIAVRALAPIVVVPVVVFRWVCSISSCVSHANRVQVPSSVVSAVRRLFEANNSLVEDGEESPWSAEDVEEMADELDARMRNAATEAARLVPGAAPVGGRVRSAGAPLASPSGTGGPGGDQMLGAILEALRSGVEAYRQVVCQLLSACVSHANPVSEWSCSSCVVRRGVVVGR